MEENEIKRLRTLTIQEALAHNDGHELLNSESGVKLFKIEVIDLFSEVDQIVSGEKSAAHMKMTKVIFMGKSCFITKGRHYLQLRWETKYKNTLEDSGLWVTLCKGKPGGWKPGWIKKMPKNVITSKKFDFHLTDKGGCRWKEVNGEVAKPDPTSEELARMLVDMLQEGMSVTG
jgi:hypothetical protein